jgi:predicted nucleic acid-binding protein
LTSARNHHETENRKLIVPDLIVGEFQEQIQGYHQQQASKLSKVNENLMKIKCVSSNVCKLVVHQQHENKQKHNEKTLKEYFMQICVSPSVSLAQQLREFLF